MSTVIKVDKKGTISYTNERGVLHRTDGPAYESLNGYKAWLINGVRHREDGPAVVWNNGDTFYFLNDVCFTKEEYEQEVAKIKLRRIADL